MFTFPKHRIGNIKSQPLTVREKNFFIQSVFLHALCVIALVFKPLFCAFLIKYPLWVSHDMYGSYQISSAEITKTVHTGIPKNKVGHLKEIAITLQSGGHLSFFLSPIDSRIRAISSSEHRKQLNVK